MIRRAFAAFAVSLAAVTSAGASSTVAQADADGIFKAGDFSAAAVVYERQVQNDPSDTASALNLGAIRLYENDLAAAAALLKKLTRRTGEASRRSTVSAHKVWCRSSRRIRCR